MEAVTASMPVLPVNYAESRSVGRGTRYGIQEVAVPAAETEIRRMYMRQLSTKMKVTQYRRLRVAAALFDDGFSSVCLIATVSRYTECYMLYRIASKFHL